MRIETVSAIRLFPVPAVGESIANIGAVPSVGRMRPVKHAARTTARSASESKGNSRNGDWRSWSASSAWSREGASGISGNVSLGS
jgi:hypothetical protein